MNFLYYAYISCAPSHSETAHRLKKALEAYSIPRVLQDAHPNIPARLRPVFDPTELPDDSSGTLSPLLGDAIRASAFLIVLCTEPEAVSPRVSREIACFLECGGSTERIIPLCTENCAPPKSLPGQPIRMSGKRIPAKEIVARILLDQTASLVLQSYKAFISYSHKDSPAVLRLHRTLEHYRPPTGVVSKKSGKQYPFRPIFLDRHNLAGPDLDRRIQLALRQSDSLIVVCSPNSAKSDYVNKEVAYFASLGKQDRIFPYILDGTPNAKNADVECYPETLRALNPLGADVHDLGHRRAFLRLVASLLGVDLDTVVQKERHRRLRKTAGICLSLLLAAAMMGGIYSANFATHVSYFANYTEENGIPVGIGPLDSPNTDLLGCYRLETRGGKVRRLLYVNRMGLPQDLQTATIRDEAPIREYAYNDQGQLDTVVLKDEDQSATAILTYENGLTELALRDPEGDITPEDAMDALMQTGLASGEKKNGVTSKKQRCDDSGRILTQMNTAYPGASAAAADSDDSYGVRYVYDDRGLPTEVWYLDAAGNPAARTDGVACLCYTYDPQYRLVQIAYLDPDRKPCDSSHGYARVNIRYEADLLRMEAFNAAGDPLPVARHGCPRHDPPL